MDPVRVVVSLSVAAAALTFSAIGPAEAAPAQQAGTSASIIDLGVSAGAWGSRGAGLDNRGDVAGATLPSPDSPDGQAAIWNNGKWTSRGAGSASAVSPNGQAVGFTGSGEAFHAALWDTRGKLHDLGTLPGGISSQATAANSHAQVVGYAQSSSLTHAFLWQSGQGMVDLGAHTSGASYAYGINDAALVVGSAGDRAVEWTASRRVVDLGAGPGSVAYGINARGDVVGDVNGRAFGWSAAHGFALLPSPKGMLSDTAVAVDSAGDIVGSAQIASASGLPTFQAVLWRHNTVCVLANLLPPNSGWTLADAVAINDRGQIVGNGLHNGQVRAYLMTVSQDPRSAC